jgi:light-regulated signal transduction histidine kinase (bacteriophytochrome)
MSVLQELIEESSPFPIVDLRRPSVPRAGLLFEVPKVCARVFPKGQCEAFYRSLPDDSTRRQCPYGFSVWAVALPDARLAVTAVVGAPRLGGDVERQRAKEYPENKVAATKVATWVARMSKLLAEGDAARNEEFSRRLEALHEIRKLNQIIKTNMERVCTKQSPNPNDPDEAPADLVRALRASGLISVQLDALDLLANPQTAMTFGPRKWVFYRVVDKIVRIYRALAENKRIKIRFNGTSMAWSQLDERTIHIIPSAFIDNAIKYSPGGGVVDVRIADEVRNGRPVVTLQVRSLGPSSTPDEEAAMFKSRGRGRAARAFTEGTGVGLVLAKVVADQHSGEIYTSQRRVENSRSEWTFTFHIPSA